jgi:Holliday junction resolvasome RuvABC endonuclease subunit
MKELKIVGVDPSVRNTGIAVGRIVLPTLSVLIDDLVLIKTESRSGKQVRKNSDDLRRANEISDALAEAAHGAAFAIVEIPTGAQSARAAWTLGMAVGIMTTFRRIAVPLIQVQPVETKLAATGKKGACKEDIIDWATEKFPAAPWKRYKRNGEMHLADDNEHLADAVAIIHAGIRTDEFRQAISLLGGIARAA